MLLEEAVVGTRPLGGLGLGFRAFADHRLYFRSEGAPIAPEAEVFLMRRGRPWRSRRPVPWGRQDARPPRTSERMDAMISTQQPSLSARLDSAKLIETRPNPPTSRQRIAWIDYARGLNIVMVVIGHVIGGMLLLDLLDDGPLLRIWDARYYNIRMPLFFVLSGIFAERWIGRTAGDFLRDKGATIVYPCIVWGVLQTSIQAIIAPITHGNTTFWHILHQLAYPVEQFWFLHVLFFLMLGYFLLRKAGLSPASCLIVALGCYAIQTDQPQTAFLTFERCLYYAPFYAVGGLAGTLTSRIRIERPWQLALIAIVGLGGLIPAGMRLGESPPLPAQLAVTLCGIAGAIALTALLSRLRFLGFLTTLGRYSLEIYTAHILAAYGLRILLHRILHVDNAAAHLVLGTIAGVGGPLLLVWLCNRLGFRYAFRLPRPAKPSRAEGAQPAPRPSWVLARASG